MMNMENLDFIGIGKRIREKREGHKLTQEQLALAIGITGRYLYDIEKGKSVMSIDILYKISKILGVSFNWVLLGKN